MTEPYTPTGDGGIEGVTDADLADFLHEVRGPRFTSGASLGYALYETELEYDGATEYEPGGWHDQQAALLLKHPWLTQHNREVAAGAWDEAYRTGENNAMASLRAGGRIVSDNPYRTT